MGVSWKYLIESLPQEQGIIHILGISASISVVRDVHGVVSISAENDQDVYFAMGFVHAQDRMWQLELQRRIAQGRLSEVLGKESVNTDVWMRTLGLYPSALKAWKVLSPNAKASLTSYTAGINAWLTSDPTLPPEFKILNIDPLPWTEVDSLAWGKVFALNLSSNMWREIEYLAAKEVLSDSQLNTLFNDYPEGAPTTVSNKELLNNTGASALLEIKQRLQHDLKIGGKYVGSNAWVISGSLTDSGNSILANDPHMGLQVPSIWYAVNQKGKNINTSGMSLIGLPLIIYGKNQNIAWGGTSMIADVQDLYFEQQHPLDPKKYKVNNQWHTFDSRIEIIKIRTDEPTSINQAIEPIEIEVRSTVHGPIINDVVGTFEQPISLSWTALQAKDTTYDAFYQLNYAKNWTEFQLSMSKLVAPALNMFYSDIDNNIGFISGGAIPVRSTGEGKYPVPGWDNKYAWQGYIPTIEMPQSFNPEKGYIVSANNKIVGDDYPYFISHDWAPPSRAKRIESLINKYRSGGISLDQMKSMQADTIDISTLEILKIVKKLKGENVFQQQALDYLRDWQGDMAKGSQAATIFHVWMDHLGDQLFLDELKISWNRNKQATILNDLGRTSGNEHILLALTDTSLNWCDNHLSEVVENCEQTMLKSLAKALKEMKKLKGGNIKNWTWGDVHTSIFIHQPFSNVNVLRDIFELQIANGGSVNSVNVANANWVSSKGYQQDFGAGFRQIMQVAGNKTQHLYMNSTGQSGNIMSLHYNDMLRPFNNVQFYSIDIASTSDDTSVLILKPKNEN